MNSKIWLSKGQLFISIKDSIKINAYNRHFPQLNEKIVFSKIIAKKSNNLGVDIV